MNGKFAEVNNKFAEVNGKSEQAPVAAVIETAAEKGGDDDGEVGFHPFGNCAFTVTKIMHEFFSAQFGVCDTSACFGVFAFEFVFYFSAFSGVLHLFCVLRCFTSSTRMKRLQTRG